MSAGCASAAVRQRATTIGNRAANDQRNQGMRRSRLAACSSADVARDGGELFGGCDNNVAPARGRGGAAYGPRTAPSNDSATRYPSAYNPAIIHSSVPLHTTLEHLPPPLPLRQTIRRVSYRSHELATFIRRPPPLPQTYRDKQALSSVRHHRPWGFSKHCRWSTHPRSSSKAINVMIYYIYVTLLVPWKRAVENTTGPKRFSNNTYTSRLEGP